MHVSELLDAIRWEVSIESSASDLQLVNNIADERIVFSVFEHGLGVFEGLRGLIAFGLPPRRPRLAAALRPARVFSTISSRWNSSNTAVI